MTNERIQRLEIQNYGCIRDATFHLTPPHALIGPNDSGKSTALRALRTLAQFGAGTFDHANTVPRPFDPMLDLSRERTLIGARYADELGYYVRTKDRGVEESVFEGHNQVAKSRGTRGWNVPGLLAKEETLQTAVSVRWRLTEAAMVRFDPNALRSPSNQLLAQQPIRFFDDTGLGLASVYQALNSRDVDAFVALRNKVRDLFPTIQNILVPTVENNAVVLQARLVDNTVVPAAALSEGLLYFLAYAALQFLNGPQLFLVEEPENGLHPSRIVEVVRILREIAKTGQVVIATHSPLVINELEGDEITVVTRDAEAGTQTTLLKDVPGFDEAMKVYQPGEFWVSYADGKSEEPLLTGKPAVVTDIVAFVRDADTDQRRPQIIDDAITKAAVAYPEVAVVGGTAVPVLEAWILALLGEHGTHRLTKAAAETKLESKGIRKGTAAMVKVAQDARLDRLPLDAVSLNTWLNNADKVFTRRLGAAEPATTKPA